MKKLTRTHPSWARMQRVWTEAREKFGARARAGGGSKGGGMKFVIFKSGDDGQWYFHLRARNGKVVFASEGYHRKGKALKTVGVIARWAGTADVVVKE